MNADLQDYDWTPLIMMAVYSIVGLIAGFTIKLDARAPATVASVLKKYGKYGALMIGIGGSLITIAQLLKVLRLYLSG